MDVGCLHAWQNREPTLQNLAEPSRTQQNLDLSHDPQVRRRCRWGCDLWDDEEGDALRRERGHQSRTADRDIGEMSDDVRGGQLPHQSWRGNNADDLAGEPAANSPRQVPSEAEHRLDYPTTIVGATVAGGGLRRTDDPKESWCSSVERRHLPCDGARRDQTTRR